MTMGRGNFGNDFGGSNKELSPRKVKEKNLLLSIKLTKSEISLNQIKDESTRASRASSTLLNMIGMPFNWKSRMLTKRMDDKKKSTNMLTNFWRKKRIGISGFACNKR